MGVHGISALGGGGSGGGAPAFDAAAEFGSKLTCWLRADDVVTSGADVTRATDKSGSGNHFDYTGGSTQEPTLVAGGAGGQPRIRFDGVDQALQLVAGRTLADLFSTSDWVVWAVFSCPTMLTNDPTYPQWNDSIMALPGGRWAIYTRSTGYVGVMTYDTLPIGYAETAYTAGTTRALTARVTGTTTLGIKLDGDAEVVSGSNGIGNFAQAPWLGFAGSISSYQEMDLYELGILNAPFGAGEQATLNSYLAGRYGVAT